MRPSKEEIDKAVEVYNANRKLSGLTDSRDENAREHWRAIRSVLETVGEPYDYQVQAAFNAYNTMRSFMRWDGFAPWGEAGTANHRAGIKAALNSFSNKD